jgi:hypothetical protein
MNIVLENPYRVLGVSADAQEKDIQKQISILKRYAEVGKSKDSLFDKFLGQYLRNVDNIDKSVSMLQQSDNKLLYSLFWFFNNNKIDETALNNLAENNVNKAIEIWTMTLKENVTKSNFSSYQNLSTLYFILSWIGHDININYVKEAIGLKYKFIRSIYFNDFCENVVGKNFNSTTDNVVKEFLKVLKKDYEKQLNIGNGLTTRKFLSMFSSFTNEEQKFLKNLFTSDITSKINSSLEMSINKRNKDPQNADVFGKELYKNIKAPIGELEKLYESTDIEFQMIVNKCAVEILQCSIEYFNYHVEKDTGRDPGEDALKLAKYALALNPASNIKTRIDENISVYEKWITDKPKRDKQKKYAKQQKFILDKFQDYTTRYSISLDDIEVFERQCSPKLLEIKNILGSYDSEYLEISNLTASYVLGIVIQILNNVGEKIKDVANPYLDRNTKMNILNDCISIHDQALNILINLTYYDLKTDLKNKIETNRRTVTDILKDLRRATGQSGSSSSGREGGYKPPPDNKGGGCYIATMAYGDYDHPQVKKLRIFRDSHLQSNFFGKIFVKVYYLISPKLVKIFRNSDRINSFIRKLLDAFIKRCLND